MTRLNFLFSLIVLINVCVNVQVKCLPDDVAQRKMLYNMSPELDLLVVTLSSIAGTLKILSDNRNPKLFGLFRTILLFFAENLEV